MELLLRQLRRRVGPVPDTLTTRLDTLTTRLDTLTTRLDTLTAAQLDDLGEALLDFQTPADLQQWLDQHSREAASA